MRQLQALPESVCGQRRRLASLLALLVILSLPVMPGAGRAYAQIPVRFEASSDQPSMVASSESGTDAPQLAVTTLAGRVPKFSHVYTIVMENKEYSSIVGNSSAPYINSLISRYGLSTHYYATTHPSEPNYLALFSGSTQGVSDDGVHNLSGRNLVDQLEAHGKSWKVFAQNVPPGCYTGSTASGGEDGPGKYARKHEPAISFTDIRGRSSRCAKITDLTHFNPAAANYELIVPNLCNDMHDCSISTGDSWLRRFVPKILNSSAWQQGGVLFITWDEGSTSTNGGGHVATLVISRRTPARYRSSIAHNHYSLLRTVEDSWGLGCINKTCSANDMSEFFP